MSRKHLPASGCTQHTKGYYVTLSSRAPVCIIDTVGIDASDDATETVLELLRSLRNTGGINLLLLCVRAGRLTDSMERVYYLISEVSRIHQVPLALVITHLENEEVMESWWDENERTFERLGIHPVAHACITAALPRETYVEKRAQSQHALEHLFNQALGVSTPGPSRLQIICNSLVKLIKNPVFFFEKRKRRAIMRKTLETYYLFPRDRARRLAELVVE